MCLPDYSHIEGEKGLEYEALCALLECARVTDRGKYFEVSYIPKSFYEFSIRPLRVADTFSERGKACKSKRIKFKI